MVASVASKLVEEMAGTILALLPSVHAKAMKRFVIRNVAFGFRTKAETADIMHTGRAETVRRRTTILDDAAMAQTEDFSNLQTKIPASAGIFPCYNFGKEEYR